MKLLITEAKDYSPKALALYAGVANVFFYEPLHGSLEEAVVDMDAMVIRLNYKISRDLICQAPNLKFIISPTTGLDHIDERAAMLQGITLVSLKGETAFLESIPSTAEHTWGLILSLVRKIPFAYNQVVAGHWNRQAFRGNNLKGKKLGIIGLGRVGRQVLKYALAFGMDVTAYDPFLTHWPAQAGRAPKIEPLLQQCDIITLHIPHHHNNNFLSRPLLEKVKKGAFLINTSRGSVWDEPAVAQLLVSRHLGGVATDVISQEQEPEQRKQNPLLQLAGRQNNLLITPHLAGATVESMHATEEYTAQKFCDILTQSYVRH